MKLSLQWGISRAATVFAVMGLALLICLGVVLYRGSAYWYWVTPVAGAASVLLFVACLLILGSEAKRRRQADRRLQLAASVFTHSHDGIVIADVDGVILDVNHAFERATGYDRSELLGKTPRVLRSGRHGPDFYAAMWGAIRERGHWIGEIWNRRKDGEIYPELLSIISVRDAAGAVQNYVAIASDMTEMKTHQQLLESMASKDPVTGLLNRARLAERATQIMAMAQRNGEQVAVLMAGIDRFRSLTLSMGHELGDRLLMAFGERMRAVMREQDALGRLPGEGFLLILPQTGSAGAAALAVKLAEAVAGPVVIDSQELAVTASVGIAIYPDDGQDFESLTACVLSAMERAKRVGGNCHQFFNGAVHQEWLESQALLKELRMAIGSDQIRVHYQPVMDLQTGQVSGMEALLRWRHPTLGDVSPSRFIPLAEESGLIKALGAWVFRRVCEDVRRWLDVGVGVPPVAINVSPVQFLDAGLVSQVDAILVEHGLDPHRICIEVTESALMEDVAKSEALLHSLKALGLKLSLDDFGTGYSSLSYLKQFPFDKVKIDQSFVKHLLERKEDAVIASAVVSMAHGLGLLVIAEGVETEMQCAFLRDNMCDEIQGYLFSAALSPESLQALVVEARRLPSHLLRVQERSRTVLLVDDEPNILSSLKRLLRRDGYTLMTAASGKEGLEILATRAIDIVVSDQRMPGMTGVEFLRTAKSLYPNTLRIILSGYTELQSVTDAINEGSVYRYLTKPWVDEQLRAAIRDAFEHKELADENQRLNLKIRTVNSELAQSNRQLLEANGIKQEIIARNELSFAVVREALRCVPMAVLSVDENGVVVFANEASQFIARSGVVLQGTELSCHLPHVSALVAGAREGRRSAVDIDGLSYQVDWREMRGSPAARGKIISLTAMEVSP